MYPRPDALPFSGAESDEGNRKPRGRAPCHRNALTGRTTEAIF
jgi:hypothetical protein